MKRTVVFAVMVGLWVPMALAEVKTAPTTRPATQAAEESQVVAYVGDRAITQGEIDKVVPRPAGAPAIPPDQLQQQRQQVLSRYLIPQKIYESYAADHPDLVSEADIDATVKKYEERVAGSGRTLEDALRQYGMTMADFRTRLVAEVVNNKLVEKAADPKATEAFYNEHKSDFDGTQFVAKHILIFVDPFFGKPEDHAKAKETLAKVKKDIESGKMTFDEAINQYSEDPGRIQGPTLPPFSRYGMMVEPFAAAAAALQPGQISDPVKTSFGYHLIQLVSREAGTPQTLEQAKDAIQNYLGGEAREKMIAEQRTKHPVKVLMPYVKPPRRELPTRQTSRPTTQASQPTADAARRRIIEQIRQRQAEIQASRPAGTAGAKSAAGGKAEKE